MGHKITNELLIVKILKFIFFVFGQISLWTISRDILRSLNFFDPEIVPHCALDNSGVKQVLAPLKYPLNWPIQ